jgi:hypothetical protein
MILSLSLFPFPFYASRRAGNALSASRSMNSTMYWGSGCAFSVAADQRRRMPFRVIDNGTIRLAAIAP